MTNLNQLTLKKATEGIKNKTFSSFDLVSQTRKRIDEIDSKLNCFLALNDKAIIEAKEADSLLDKDKNNINKPLLGVPFAVKDVLSTRGIKTTASSQILNDYVPVFDATVVKKLKNAGAIILGKTNCDAFAFGASTENSGFGVTKNPWDLTRVPGGSSGGSAAAVSADECIFSLGTDTGGSIRQPSSFCSVTGLKPTYGACSRWGLLAMASSFDCPGPIAKSAEDCEILFNIIAGPDGKDATASSFSSTKTVKNRLTLGIPKEYFTSDIDEEVKISVSKAVKLLEKNGFLVKEVSLPNTFLAIPAYYILVPSEISSNMARYDGIRFGKERSNFEDEVKRRIITGTFTLSSGYFDQYYLKASKVRKLFQDDFARVFEKVDLLITPVTPTPPFKIGENSADPVKMYLADILTSGANLAGIPGLALPCGFTKSNLPIGLQILGPHFSENLLFFVGKAFQELTDWHLKKPNI